MFVIKPAYLTRIAAASECLNPDLIEMNPFVLEYDRAIAQITRSFVYEMQSEALGGKLYFETLATQLAIHLLRRYCTYTAKLKRYERGLSHQQLRVVTD